MLRILLLAFSVFITLPAMAQQTPPMPAPLQQQRANGAQIYYLGRYDVLEGWAVIRSGQPEFYYSTPGNHALVMGILFNENGNAITQDQLGSIDLSQRGGVVDMMASKLKEAAKTDPELAANLAPMPTPETPAAAQTAAAPAPAPTAPVIAPSAPQARPAPAAKLDDVANQLQPATPANKLYADVQRAPGVLIGQEGAPVLYAFIDPNCPHCQYFLDHISDLIKAGAVAVRAIPVAFDDKSRKQAAMVLAAGNGGDLLMAYAKGDKNVLLAPANIDVAAVSNNTGLMTSWNLMATPIIIYKSGRDGEIKLIRGRPLDLAAVIEDIRPR